MTMQRRALHHLEGRTVRVALRDGTRMDACLLISRGHGPVGSVWLFADGRDVFVALPDIVGVSATSAAAPRAA
jgi:hypothetical protein